MRWRSAILAAMTAATATALLAGCPQKADSAPVAPMPPDARRSVGQDPVDAAWPFWPDRMRIHPLTMFSRDPKTGGPVIEARLEFFDEYGHRAKCVGQVRFELHDHDPGDEPDEPQRVWNIDLRDLKDNALHYDMVTLTYLFRLGLESELAAGEWRLRAHVLSADGRKFRSVARLR